MIKIWYSTTAAATPEFGPQKLAKPLHQQYRNTLSHNFQLLKSPVPRKMRKLTSELIPYTRKIPTSKIASSRTTTSTTQGIFQLPPLQGDRWAILTTAYQKKKESSMENVSSTEQVWQSYNQLKSGSYNRNWQGNSSYLCCLDSLTLSGKGMKL